MQPFPVPGFGPALLKAAQGAPVGVLVAVESPGGFVPEFVNDRVVELLGEVPARLPDDLNVHESVRERLSGWLRGGGAADLELEAVARRGAARVALHVVGSRVADPVRPAFVLFLYESHVQRRTALAESEAQFQRLLDWAPDAILLATANKFLYANPALVRMLGYAHMDEMTRVPVLEHVHPEDRALARRTARILLENGAPQPPLRFRAVRSDGRAVPLDVRTMGIEWDGERAVLMVGRDLSERRRLQAQSIRADRLAAMGTLAAGVAHEINNPLAYLMLNLQFLMRELPRFDGDPARLATFLERLAEAEHGARRVSSIVGDLRTFARPEHMDSGPIAVADAIAQAVKVVGPQVRRRARLVEEYQAVPIVRASLARLEQVFVNLLGNAAQAVPEGGAARNEVVVSLFPEGDKVIVEVRDTGTGIAPDALRRVFDPFFTTKPRGVGTGLGLPISRGIVRAFGGDLTVKSTVGVGTTFRVTLPAATDVEAAAPSSDGLHPSSPVHPPVDRARVLVVDDEPLVAEMLKRTLSEVHDVTAVTDADSALERVLSGEEFDVIFCDLLMPRTSGMDLYEELEKRRPGVQERIVFMTGGAFTERAARFLGTVPNPKVTKPFDLAMIERIVARMLRSRTL